LEVTARHLNEVEAVQHVHLTNIPVWFGLLGDVYGTNLFGTMMYGG